MISHKGCFTFTVHGTPEQSLNVCKRGPLDGNVFVKSVKGKRGAEQPHLLRAATAEQAEAAGRRSLQGHDRLTDAAGNRSSPRVQELAVDAILADG